MVKISDFDVLMGFERLQINNGKFSEDEATKIAQTYYGTNESMMKKAKDLIGVCSKKGKRNNNNTRRRCWQPKSTTKFIIRF